MGVHRITLFKIPEASHQDEALQKMRGLKEEAKKVARLSRSCED